jgi:hypothetical protein
MRSRIDIIRYAILQGGCKKPEKQKPFAPTSKASSPRRRRPPSSLSMNVELDVLERLLSERG